MLTRMSMSSDDCLESNYYRVYEYIFFFTLESESNHLLEEMGMCPSVSYNFYDRIDFIDSLLFVPHSDDGHLALLVRDIISLI